MMLASIPPVKARNRQIVHFSQKHPYGDGPGRITSIFWSLGEFRDFIHVSLSRLNQKIGRKNRKEILIQPILIWAPLPTMQINSPVLTFQSPFRVFVLKIDYIEPVVRFAPDKLFYPFGGICVEPNSGIKRIYQGPILLVQQRRSIPYYDTTHGAGVVVGAGVVGAGVVGAGVVGAAVVVTHIFIYHPNEASFCGLVLPAPFVSLTV